MLVAQPRGDYHFVQGIDPYSCGVRADPGHEVVHVVLRDLLPWRDGFDRVDAHLQGIGRGRQALCGVELRSPAPYTMQEFIRFNAGYCEVLQSWGVYVDGLNPVARTNVAPVDHPPAAPVLYGFSYTAPVGEDVPVTFVVAGAGELLEGALDETGIIRRGETGPEAMREKASYVVDVMDDRLRRLGGTWQMVNAINVYTVYLHEGLLEDTVVPRVGSATRHGLRLQLARPPVVDIDYEMDARGVRTELLL